MKDDYNVILSSGNVFADLEFPDPDGEMLRAQKRLLRVFDQIEAEMEHEELLRNIDPEKIMIRLY